MSLPIINTEASQRSKIRQYLGSFWNTAFSAPSQILALSNLVRQTSLLGDFKSVFHNLAGQHVMGRKKTFTVVSFKTDQILRTGMQYFDDPSVTALFGNDASDSSFSFNFYRVPYSAIHMGQITPTLIQASGRTLALGVDFFLETDFVFFREDPTVLFPSGFFTVLQGIDTGYKAFMSDFLGINCPEYQDLLIQYVKKYQTPGWFKLAASAAAGMVILRHTQKLLDTHQTIYGTIYIFEKETLQVSYAHTPLIIGITYDKYYVIGDGLQIVYGDGSGTRWWRQIDWCGGLSLDPLLPTFKGLQLLDQDTYAFAAGSDLGSVGGNQLHTRVDLGCADWQLESEYWSQVAELETAFNMYLNAVVGLKDAVDSGNPALLDTFVKLEAAYVKANALNQGMGWPLEKPDYTALPDKILVNALDIFFEAVLADVGMVIRVDPTRVGDVERLYSFLQAEMTPGATPVIIAFPPILPGELVDNQTGTIITVGPSVSYAFAYSEVTEIVNLNSMVTGSAKLNQNLPLLNLN